MKIIFKISIAALSIMSAFCGVAICNDWHVIPTGRQENFNSFFICDQNNEFIISGSPNGMFFRYSDERNRWLVDSIPGTVLQDIYFLKGCQRGFICGSRGTFSYSEDFGQKWTSFNFDTSLWLYDVVFKDSLTGFLVGINSYSRITSVGVAFKTSDGGHTWDSIPIGGIMFSSIDIAPDGTVTIKGQGRIYISRDTGVHWDTIAAPPGESPNAVRIIGKSGLMIGMGGYVASSSDGGKTWKPLYVLTENIHLFDLLMLNEKIAYAVGSDGMVLYTDDGGRNWVPEASGTPQQLTKIRLVGNRIYVCGQGGALICKDIDLPKSAK